MSAPACNDNDHDDCPYPGWLVVVCWFVGIFGSWALLLGAGALAQWLYESILALGAT
jgi:hypothetical protein